MSDITFRFDGDVASYVGTIILAYLLIVFTLGIGTPWAVCMLENWKATHTLIGGKRCKFVGTGGELFGKWIVWWLLTFITLGIYSFWAAVNLQKWRVEKTEFELA